MDDAKPIKVCLCGSSGVGCNQLARVTVGEKFDPDSPCITGWRYERKELIINKKNIH